MTKLTVFHVTALQHAIGFMKPSIDRFPDERLRNAVARDVERLEHILEHLKAHVYAPALPFRKVD